MAPTLGEVGAFAFLSEPPAVAGGLSMSNDQPPATAGGFGLLALSSFPAIIAFSALQKLREESRSAVTIAPYGSWKSPITSDLIVKEMIGLSQPRLDGEDIYWIEMRPSERGRQVIVRRSADGATTDINPSEFNARTRVHEYGGGDYVVHDGVVYFANFGDQQLYRQKGDSAPERITTECSDDRLRYADAVLDVSHGRLISVREDHRQADHEARNT